MRGELFAVGLAALGALGGCTTYSDDLARGQTAFEANNHERALAIFRALEVDQGHLTPAERGHYAYLRGMTDYRVGYRADARHWLLVAAAIERETPGVLPVDWKKRLDESLGELNDVVYKSGTDALTNARANASKTGGEPTTDEGNAPKPKKKVKSEDEP